MFTVARQPALTTSWSRHQTVVDWSGVGTRERPVTNPVGS